MQGANKIEGFIEYHWKKLWNMIAVRKTYILCIELLEKINTCLAKLSLLACFFLDLAEDVEKGGLHAMAVQSMFPKWICDGKTMHYHMISHKACSQKIDS